MGYISAADSVGLSLFRFLWWVLQSSSQQQQQQL